MEKFGGNKMNNKKLYQKNIILNYIFTFTINLNLTQGLWMLYLATKGLSLAQLGLLEGVFHLTSFLMETPTGAISDIFGRKWSRYLGRCLSLLHIIILINADSFSLFIVAFIICALSYNLESGSGEALVYDSLIELDKENTFIKVNGIIEFCCQTAAVISLCIAGYIATNNYILVFIIEAMLVIVSIIQTLFFHETTVSKNTDHTKITFLNSIKNQYKDSISIIFSNPKLAYLIVFVSLMGTFNTLSFFYLQNYWRSYDYNEFNIGVFLSFASIAGAIGGLLASKIEKILKPEGILRYMPIIMVICLYGLSHIKFSFFFFIIMGFVDSIVWVATSDYINKLIPSDSRATILSFESMTFSLCMILTFPLFGFIADHLDMRISYILLAIISMIFTVINYVILGRFKKSNN